MDIGTGVAIAGGAISIAAVLIKWLSVAFNSNSQCAAHSFISEQIKEMKEWMIRVEGKIDRAIRDKIPRDE